MTEVAEKMQNIYSFIIQEEASFKSTRVPLASNWRDWNFYEHVDRSYTLKNSQFYKGNQDYTRPFNNIILPIANVAYRTEGFDVKDVDLYVDDRENYHKSFIARKFHDRWAVDQHIDRAIDESVESYFDYGLTLVKNVNESRPEVVDLRTIAFCDQTDILSGPLCIKHYLSPSQIQEFEGKWDADAIRTALLMAMTSREQESDDSDSVETPGKYIEVYELHGDFPESWLGAEKLGMDWEDTGKYSPQVHIITYYISPSDKSKVGLTLFKGKEPKPVFKALKRDPIQGRACGRGGIEELFHPQIWTNYSELQIAQMLETVSKVILTTNKKSIVQLNNLSNVKQGQILDIGDGGRLEQLIIQPINKVAFDGKIEKWEQVARSLGSASDPQLGINPVSGTPLGTTEIVTAQGQGVHEYRRGKIADFWTEIYREWTMPHLQKEIMKKKQWLIELTTDEIAEVMDKAVTNRVNEKFKERLFNIDPMTSEELEQAREIAKEQFLKAGNKRFAEIIKDEFKDLALDVNVNIAGRPKNLGEMITKLNSVFRTLFTPGAIEALGQSKELGGLLNEILEAAGLSPIVFSGITAQRPQQQQPQQQQLQQLQQPNPQEQELAPLTT